MAGSSISKTAQGSAFPSRSIPSTTQSFTPPCSALSLQILRIDIHPRRRHDDAFLPSLEIKLAVFVHLRQISGVKPAVLLHHWLQLFVAPITGGNIFAPHQNFASVADLHFQPGNNFPIEPFPSRNG